MLRVFTNLENDRDLWIKTLGVDRRKVSFGVKHETVGSRRQRFLKQEEWLHSALIIGPGMS
jgi:hypothetical protein